MLVRFTVNLIEWSSIQSCRFLNATHTASDWTYSSYCIAGKTIMEMTNAAVCGKLSTWWLVDNKKFPDIQNIWDCSVFHCLVSLGTLTVIL